MSIRPIDLQTLLMQMTQVGREQAIEKDGAALQASIKGAEEQKKHDETKEAIRRTDEKELAPEAIHDRLGQSSQGAARSGEENPASSSDEEAAGKDADEVVRDPDLGKHIDLTG